MGIGLGRATTHTSRNAGTAAGAWLVVAKHSLSTGAAGPSVWPHRRLRAPTDPEVGASWLNLSTTTNAIAQPSMSNPATVAVPVTTPRVGGP